MKTILLAIAALVGGIGVGLAGTWWEFSGDRLPTQLSPVPTSSSNSAASTVPRVVVVDGETFNFGKMDRHTSMTHDFVLRNDGDAALTLVKGETTCKCTQFDLEREYVAPGQSTKVTLTWQAKTTEQEFTQSAELTTNDPQRGRIRLVVTGRIVDAVRPERFEVLLGTISANEDNVARLKLFAYRSDALNIDNVELTNAETADFFEITFEPLPEEEVKKERDATTGVEMIVKIKSGLPLGPITQTIRLKTDAAEQPTLDIPVVGKVVSDISLAGPKLDADLALLTLGTVEQAVGTKATIYLIVKGPHRDETELRVASTDPAANLKATLTKATGENSKIKRYSLTVEIPPGSPSISRLASGQMGKIVIETTHPQVKHINLNVRFAVKE